MKKEAILYEMLDRKQVSCYLCAHRCKITNSRYGLCGVRQNVDGTLYTRVYAQAIAANIDPIEKSLCITFCLEHPPILSAQLGAIFNVVFARTGGFPNYQERTMLFPLVMNWSLKR